MTLISSNFGAMASLQSLRDTESQIAQSQSRLSTGRTVTSAKDSGHIYDITQTMRSDIGGLRVVNASLDRAASVIDVAIAGAEGVQDLLIEMREVASKASDTSLSDTEIASLNQQWLELQDQVNLVARNAEFDGINLLQGTQKADNRDQIWFRYQTGTPGETVGVYAEPMQFTIVRTPLGFTLGSDLYNLPPHLGATPHEAARYYGNILDNELKEVADSLSRLGSHARYIGIYKQLTSQLSDTLQAGIGNLIDADMAKETARMEAFKAKKELSLQALSIANATAGAVIGLFDESGERSLSRVQTQSAY